MLVLKTVFIDNTGMDIDQKLAHRNRKRLLILALLALTLYVVLPQVHGFQASFKLLRHINVGLVLLATGSLATTFVLAAATYHCLARKPLLYRRTVLVAVANMFTNRLLPAGAGSIATFFMYLRRRNHTVSQASSVVAVNNIIGFLSHGVLLAIVLAVSPGGLSGFQLPAVSWPVVAVGLGVVLLAVILVSLKQAWHRSVWRFLRSLAKDMRYYQRQPWLLLAAFSTSLLMTVFYAAALWCCILAVHASLAPAAALAVFTIGVITGTLTPTPGGLGGVEAGLLAGLVAYRLPADQALAAVLLYRLLSYWLTLAVGIVTYVYVDHRGYLQPVSSRRKALI
ncbi:MAG: lysylphosphatidylglycerol synthase transmembrane domain-containing protein [Patescibacteria group bacterium]|nr:lysylphosphatidylglycerol synthase transmembrane domain-containing protein [Patescibacteria group bacterium]